ncbi:hypothetical protein [Streptomyces sp. NPDC005385]|uniref:hypothetical protein n=1 Tax=Streptomyces sp. NPDC005385 TaxID=3157039 RepID=UPI0033B7A366
MDINVTAAASRLGMSEPAVRQMIAAGRLARTSAAGAVRVSDADVERVRVQRRNEALRRHQDIAAFAREIRRVLWPTADRPDDTVELTDGRVQFRNTVPQSGNAPREGTQALPFLPVDATAVFGPHVLQAAAASPLAFKDSCRWCFADAAARVHETQRPQNTPSYRVLLGEPCERDRARFRAEEAKGRKTMTALRAKVEAGTRQADKDRARTEYDAAQRGASGAAARLRQATEALVRVDPSSAATVASGAPGASRFPTWCRCTADAQCEGHRRGRR